MPSPGVGLEACAAQHTISNQGFDVEGGSDEDDEEEDEDVGYPEKTGAALRAKYDALPAADRRKAISALHRETSYDLWRENNIAQREETIRSLGLDVQPLTKQATTTKRQKKKRATATNASRRSTRNNTDPVLPPSLSQASAAQTPEQSSEQQQEQVLLPALPPLPSDSRSPSPIPSNSRHSQPASLARPPALIDATIDITHGARDNQADAFVQPARRSPAVHIHEDASTAVVNGALEPHPADQPGSQSTQLSPESEATGDRPTPSNPPTLPNRSPTETPADVAHTDLPASQASDGGSSTRPNLEPDAVIQSWWDPWLKLHFDRLLAAQVPDEDLKIWRDLVMAYGLLENILRGMKVCLQHNCDMATSLMYSNVAGNACQDHPSP